LTARGRRWHRLAEPAAFALYLALLGIGLAHHAMWRDEWAAWLIVRDSVSLAEIVRHLRYEGHPALYYLILDAAKPFVGGQMALQGVQAATAGAVAAMLLWASPFTLAERLLLPFGAYTLFEYGIKSRSYALGFLLVCVLCALWGRPRRDPPHPVVIGAVLALLANVHVLFALLACAAAAALAAGEVSAAIHRRSRPTWAHALGGLVFGAGLLVALATAMPSPDTAFASTPPQSALWRSLGGLTALGALVGWVSLLGVAPGLMVVIDATRGLRANRAAQGFFLATTLGLLAFFQVLYIPGPQHSGVLFTALVAAAWIARGTASDRTGTIGFSPRLLVPVLLCQCATGGYFYAREFVAPTSNSRAAAAFIRSHGWDRQEIVALADFKAQSVLGYLNAPSFFYIPGHRRGSFVIWNTARLGAHDRLQPGDLAGTCPLTLIADAPLPADNAAAFGLSAVASFDGAEETHETYVLYRRECK
jgi:hypothetical protein